LTLEIREYTQADLEACRELWRDLTQRHRDIYEDPSIGGADPGPYFDEHYLTDPRFTKLWLAELDGEVIGMCGLFVDSEEAELEPIVVRSSERSRGVGALLAERVIEEARTLGKRFINVRPVGRNVEAIAFFNRVGFDLLGRLELSLQLDADAFRAPKKQVDVHGIVFDY
jgi:GNAT superfamily N-acetyltransferase